MIRLSIIIPSYNRMARLRACLDALAAQTQPPDTFEVIVVLDGCTDDSRLRLETFDPPYRLTVLEQENAGPGSARNRGASAAEAPVCLFLDDDVIASPELVRAHLRLHEQQQRVAGIGAIEIRLGHGADWFARHFAAGWHAHQRDLALGSRSATWEDCLSGNLSVHRDVFLAAGGFAPELRRSEDVELGYRLFLLDVSFAYIEDASCVQEDGKTVRDYGTDFERSGAAWVEVCRRHPELVPVLLAGVIDISIREAAVRRLLAALRVTPRMLATFAPLFASEHASRRWYRFIFRYAYWRGVRRAYSSHDEWARLTHGTAILAYHAFGSRGEPASRYVVPVRKFKRQMGLLYRLGFPVLSLAQYLALRRQNELPPMRSVVITIDDGYAETATLAAPILEEYGFPATVFLVTDQVGKHNVWDANGPLAGRPLLSWADVERMAGANFQFGAHTRTHPILSRLRHADALREIEGSKHDLERATSGPVHAFAYPFGEFDAATEQMTVDAGFLGSCTVESGLNSVRTPTHALRRLTVDGTWALPRFLLAVWLGRTRFHLGSSQRVPLPSGTDAKRAAPLRSATS